MFISSRVQKDGHNVHFMETGLSSLPYSYPPNITNTYFQLPCKFLPVFLAQHLRFPVDYSESTFYWDIWRNRYDSRDNIDVWKVGDRAIDYMYHNNFSEVENIATFPLTRLVFQHL